MEVRVGGIYTLERLAGEALASPAEQSSGPDLYWTVMETLTAFARGRTRGQGSRLAAEGRTDKLDYLWGSDAQSDVMMPPPSAAPDISGVAAVIRRRPKAGRNREMERDWRFDLRGAWLQFVNLEGAHLERADLLGAHLESARLRNVYLEQALLRLAHLDGAVLHNAHLRGADLRQAHLNRAALHDARLWNAHLSGAHLKGAWLIGAHLQDATLEGAHLEGANLSDAHLAGTNFRDAHLEGATLTGAELEDAFLGEGAPPRRVRGLDEAFGDAKTRLPDGWPRPAHWPEYDPNAL